MGRQQKPASRGPGGGEGKENSLTAPCPIGTGGIGAKSVLRRIKHRDWEGKRLHHATTIGRARGLAAGYNGRREKRPVPAGLGKKGYKFHQKKSGLLREGGAEECWGRTQVGNEKDSRIDIR